MTKIILTVAYLSMFGKPCIETTPFEDRVTCQKEATKIYNQVRAGTTRAWCAKVMTHENQTLKIKWCAK